MNPALRLACVACGLSVEDWAGSGGECPRCGAAILDAVPSAWGVAAGDLRPTSVSHAQEGAGGPSGGRPGRDLPEVIGRFRLRSRLGGGESGHVYLAHDPRLERDIALKVLPEGRDAATFQGEARAAARLDHPHIVPLHDAGRDGGRAWIAYQHVHGEPLSRRRDGRPIGAARAARLVLALAEALEHAHSLGVFHRDLKPSNILIEPAGTPRVTDFGLVPAGPPPSSRPDAEARRDLLALGRIFHEILHGAPPMAPVRGAATRAPGPPRRRAPRGLDRLCRRVLDDGYGDARALAADLRDWLNRREARRRFAHNAMLASVSIVALVAAVCDGLAHASRPAIAPEIKKAEPEAVTKPAFPRMVVRTPNATPPTAAPSTFFTRKGSQLFHRPECPSARGVGVEERLLFPSAEEAASRGYRPCVLCRP